MGRCAQHLRVPAPGVSVGALAAARPGARLCPHHLTPSPIQQEPQAHTHHTHTARTQVIKYPSERRDAETLRMWLKSMAGTA